MDSFLFIFGSVQTNITTIFTIKLMRKNVHPVYSAGIRTHNLQIMSLLPSRQTRAHPEIQLLLLENTNLRGSITVWLTSCLYCLDSANMLN